MKKSKQQFIQNNIKRLVTCKAYYPGKKKIELVNIIFVAVLI